jgi:deoxyribodipyrimidine photo-lyase
MLSFLLKWSPNKEEYSAATLRRKLQNLIPRFLASIEEQTPVIDSTGLEFESVDISDISEAISRLNIDRSVRHSTFFHGGSEEAKKHLGDFMMNKLDRYSELKNDPK